MKIIIRRSGAEMPYEIINNAVSIKENEHCIIVNTKTNRLMYSKPEFEMEEQDNDQSNSNGNQYP